MSEWGVRSVRHWGSVIAVITAGRMEVGRMVVTGRRMGSSALLLLLLHSLSGVEGQVRMETMMIELCTPGRGKWSSSYLVL